MMDILEDYLFNRISKEDAKRQIAELQKEKGESYCSPALRAIDAYSSSEMYDFVSNLKQYCLYSFEKVSVPKPVREFLYGKEDYFGIELTGDTLSAIPCGMGSPEDLSHEYHFEYRRNDRTSAPDGDLLRLFSKRPSYINLQQKLMIYSLKRMKPGDCMLACLPTGSGKSMLWQYGVASRLFDKLTVVVTPTIALMDDHVQSDEEVFGKLPWVSYIAYSSDKAEKDANYLEKICQRIKKATSTILYISPEAMFKNSKIMYSLEVAARAGRISALVIDEAHLILDWGMNFRPEFQFLPVVFNRWNSLGRRIYTVLLSATITDYDTETLKALFSHNDFIEFRGDSLRQEHSYYFHECKNEREREDCLVSLIGQVPKPAIVYTGTKEQTSRYALLIRQKGFKRVDTYTAETRDKATALTRWRKNNTDVMVATSAFGMGVDKGDVRTVITAYTPENISRFYQEVGRSGRDGYSAMSFILTCPKEDTAVRDKMINNKILTDKVLMERWHALRTSVEYDENHNAWKFDVNAKKMSNHLDDTGEHHVKWNLYVLLLLARRGVLELTDVKTFVNNGTQNYFVFAKPKDDDLFNDEGRLGTAISEYLEKEREEIRNNRDMIKSMFSIENTECYATSFKQAFPKTSLVCSGCPSCRKKGYSTYADVNKIEVNDYAFCNTRKALRFNSNVSLFCNMDSRVMIGFDSITEDETVDLMQRMLAGGIRLVVLGAPIKNYRNILPVVPNSDYLIVDYDEYRLIPEIYKRESIMWIMNGDDNMTDLLLRESNKLYKRGVTHQVLAIRNDYYDDRQRKKVSAYVEMNVPLSIVLAEDVIC